MGVPVCEVGYISVMSGMRTTESGDTCGGIGKILISINCEKNHCIIPLLASWFAVFI